MARKKSCIREWDKISRNEQEYLIDQVITELREWNPDSESADEIQDVLETDGDLLNALEYGLSEIREWNPHSEFVSEVEDILKCKKRR